MFWGIYSHISPQRAPARDRQPTRTWCLPVQQRRKRYYFRHKGTILAGQSLAACTLTSTALRAVSLHKIVAAAENVIICRGQGVGSSPAMGHKRDWPG